MFTSPEHPSFTTTPSAVIPFVAFPLQCISLYKVFPFLRDFPLQGISFYYNESHGQTCGFEGCGAKSARWLIMKMIIIIMIIVIIAILMLIVVMIIMIMILTIAWSGREARIVSCCAVLRCVAMCSVMLCCVALSVWYYTSSTCLPFLVNTIGVLVMCLPSRHCGGIDCTYISAYLHSQRCGLRYVQVCWWSQQSSSVITQGHLRETLCLFLPWLRHNILGCFTCCWTRTRQKVTPGRADAPPRPPCPYNNNKKEKKNDKINSW